MQKEAVSLQLLHRLHLFNLSMLHDVSLLIVLGEPLCQYCSNKAAKLLHKRLHKGEEMKDSDFHAFPCYDACSAELGLVSMLVFISFHFK